MMRWVDKVVKDVGALTPDAQSRERERAAVATELDSIRDAIEQLTMNQGELVAMVATPPCTVTPPPSPRPPPIPYPDKCEVALAARTAPGRITKHYGWWCPTHGVNTNHGREINGTGFIPCQNPKANHNSEATFQNPMGGNTRRNDKAGKWWVANADGSNPRVVNSPDN